jgi:hypothetical protein
MLNKNNHNYSLSLSIYFILYCFSISNFNASYVFGGYKVVILGGIRG